MQNDGQADMSASPVIFAVLILTWIIRSNSSDVGNQFYRQAFGTVFLASLLASAYGFFGRNNPLFGLATFGLFVMYIAKYRNRIYGARPPEPGEEDDTEQNCATRSVGEDETNWLPPPK